MTEDDAGDADRDVDEVIDMERLLLGSDVRARPDVVMGFLHESFGRPEGGRGPAFEAAPKFR